MHLKMTGAQTRCLSSCPAVVSFAAVGGRHEGEGPLREYFDELSEDHFFGEKTWEKGESTMQRRALSHALEKAGLKERDIDLVLAGDLLNQCTGSSFALRDSRIPFYGLYGACSTMGESLSLAALLLDGGFAERAAALTSSHFCTAERQYRMPVPYGSQRTPTAQWTATGSGCCILGRAGEGPYITHVTTGRIVDMGITDANNMGAAMAPVSVKLTPCATHIGMRNNFSTHNSNERSCTRAIHTSQCPECEFAEYQGNAYDCIACNSCGKASGFFNEADVESPNKRTSISKTAFERKSVERCFDIL